MIGLLLAFGAFFAWWIIGLAFLVLMRADVASLRLALAAPALGTAVTVLLLFALSRAGAAMEEGALPLMSILLGLSVVVLVLRRPRVSLFVVPVIALCIANLFLIGRPMLSYGFNWIANANDDMANYVLAATTLLHHGLLAPLDVAALTNDRDYASAFQVFQTGGVRPGGNVMLAGLAAVVGRPPYQLYMPLTLALNLCAISGAGALAMQVSRRWIVAALAAALIAVSPLATYGVVQQLLPQVWGLGLAVVLLALLMRSELHRDPGPQLKDAVLVGILVAAVILVYVELAFTLALAYALYLALLAARRRIAVVPLLRLWAPAIAIICLVLNTYLLRELEFLSSQATFGLRGIGRAPLFGYSLVPSALPAVV